MFKNFLKFFLGCLILVSFCTVGFAEKAKKKVLKAEIKENIEMTRDEATRFEANDRLIEIGKPALPYLSPLLNDSDDNIKRNTIRIIGEIGDSSSIKPLIELLGKETGAKVKRSIFYALGNLKAKEAIPFLKDALSDKDTLVRSDAAYNLGKIGDAGDATIIDTLGKLLKDKEDRVRASVVEALNNIGTAKALPYLREMIKDKNEKIRVKAAYGLGKHGGEEDGKVLIDALNDKSADVRRFAASALGEIKHAPSLPYLKKLLLSDPNDKVRASAAFGLGQIGGSDSIRALKEALKDKSEYVRNIVKFSLDELGVEVEEKEE